MAHTDVHCHLLPGLDDGPTTLAEALAMARIAVDDGISTIVVTPHAHQVNRPGEPDLATHIQGFGAALHTAGVNLRLLPGAEHRLLPNLPQLADSGALIRLNGSRYVLVELDPFSIAKYTRETLFQLRLRGLVPVLAHPERQQTIQQRPRVVQEIVEQGVLLQVTASSLTGGFGPRARKTAEGLLRERLVAFVATDAHQADGHRKPVASEGLHAVARLTDEATATLLSESNPAAVVANDDVRPATMARRRSWSIANLLRF